MLPKNTSWTSSGPGRLPTALSGKPSVRFHRRFWLVCLLLALVSCSAPGPQTVHRPIQLAAYRPFLTSGLFLPFRTTGSLRLIYRGEAQAGDFILMGGSGGDFQLQLLTPFTGALALEVRFDSQRLLVLDYANSTYYSGSNTSHNRNRLLGLDMTAREFLMAVTARLPREMFERGDGRQDSDGRLWMVDGSVEYNFQLNQWGLPDRWEKTINGQSVFRVEYRSYMELAAGPGPPLLMPRKIRVYTEGEKPVLILGVREIMPGVSYTNPPGFDPPRDGRWRPEAQSSPMPPPMSSPGS